MDDLAILSEKDIVKAQDVAAEAYEVELVWREAVSLGIQLLMNDESGYMKVVDFPRGGQARNVAEAANLDPEIFKGATITAVNGKRFELPKVPLNPDADANEPPPPPPTTVPQVLAALQVPERPVARLELGEPLSVEEAGVRWHRHQDLEAPWEVRNAFHSLQLSSRP